MDLQTVGGMTMHWTASCPRMQSHELKARSTYGAIPDTSLEDWPLDLATLEPYYSKAEDRMGVTEPTEFRDYLEIITIKCLRQGDEKSDIGNRYQ